MRERTIREDLESIEALPRRYTKDEIMDAGACKNIANPEIFFSEQQTGPNPRRAIGANERRARALCNDCLMRIPCLDYSTIPHSGRTLGTWGGRNEDERKTIRNLRNPAETTSATPPTV